MQLCFYYLFIEGVCDRIVQYETRLQSLLISNCHDKKDDHITTLQVAIFEHNYISLTLCIYTLQQEWAKKLRGKDEEIESFRKDMDAIIETLQHLHDQSN